MNIYNQRTITHWYGSIMHALMAQLFSTSHILINWYTQTAAKYRDNPLLFYNRRIWDDAIKVYIQLDEVIILVYTLFNYICQNRIFSSHKLICPSMVNQWFGGLPYITHFQILVYSCVGGIRCCVGGLPYTTHFQIYVVLEVLDVVFEVFHTQHTFKYMLCWRY